MFFTKVKKYHVCGKRLYAINKYNYITCLKYNLNYLIFHLWTHRHYETWLIWMTHFNKMINQKSTNDQLL